MDEIFTFVDKNQNGELDYAEFNQATSIMFLMNLQGCPAAVTPVCVPPPAAKKWGYGILANTIMCLISFIGVVLIPFKKFPRVEKYMTSILIGFAVGALIGDALLHIIPEILSIHEPEEALSGKNYIWPLVVVFSSVCLFFTIERIVFFYFEMKGQRKNNQKPIIYKNS